MAQRLDELTYVTPAEPRHDRLPSATARRRQWRRDRPATRPGWCEKSRSRFQGRIYWPCPYTLRRRGTLRYNITFVKAFDSRTTEVSAVGPYTWKWKADGQHGVVPAFHLSRGGSSLIGAATRPTCSAIAAQPAIHDGEPVLHFPAHHLWRLLRSRCHRRCRRRGEVLIQDALAPP